MRIAILTICLLFQLTDIYAQSNKKAQEAQKSFDEGKIDKAISQMEKVVGEEPSNDNWDVLINMYYRRYEYSKKSTDVNAETNSTLYFNDLIVNCKSANIQSQSPLASQLLRKYFVDSKPDTAISAQAKNEFNQAESFFRNKDYLNAKIHYQNALTIKPNYYNAIIYLGDSYWYLDKIDSAIFYFRKGIEMYPNILEPRIYLLDALIITKKDEEAKKEFMDALYVYPDETMFSKYADFCERQGIKFNRHWMKRGCEINTVTGNSKKVSGKTWSIYQDAKEQIKAKCDSDGIITNGGANTGRYLEVYCWERMLIDSAPLPEELKYAQKMQEAGYLDCYVLISLFQFDLYGQYADFVKNNKDKIKNYVDTYLIEK